MVIIGNQTWFTSQSDTAANCSQFQESNQSLIRCNVPSIDLKREAALSAQNEKRLIRSAAEVKHSPVTADRTH